MPVTSQSEMYRITLSRSLYDTNVDLKGAKLMFCQMLEIYIHILIPPRTFLQYRKPQIFCNRKQQSQERAEVHRLM